MSALPSRPLTRAPPRIRVARLGIALAGLLFAAVGVRAQAQTADPTASEGTATKVKRWISGSWGTPQPTPYPVMGEIAVPIATPKPTANPGDPPAASLTRRHGDNVSMAPRTPAAFSFR